MHESAVMTVWPWSNAESMPIRQSDTRGARVGGATDSAVRGCGMFGRTAMEANQTVSMCLEYDILGRRSVSARL